MSRVVSFLTRRRGGKGWHWTDVFIWIWLIGGLVLMFGPALWLLMSSFKTPQQLAEFPPSFLPYATQQVTVEGFDRPLNLFTAKLPDGSTKVMAEVRRIGTVSQLVDPQSPGEIVKVNIADRQPVREMRFATENYSEPFAHFDFLQYFKNSVFVTVIATLITLLTNSMAAFALSKYQFRGRNVVLLLIVGTLMVPLSVLLVPLYSVISAVGLFDSLWGVILPTVATPTGVSCCASICSPSPTN
jgi:alpha-1,4-digalacturonate transport system permease protein